jgi:branched-chain amino acid transport system permease protein
VSSFIAYTIYGIVIGAAYAIAASGLVLTYATSRVFNMAHGAIGMFMGFVFWELGVHHGLPIWLATLLVVCVIAPAFGVLIQRLMMRDLADAPVSISLVVTVGLLVLLLGGAQKLWPPSNRRFRGFFYPHGVRLGPVKVSANDIIATALAIAVAVALYVLLEHTRIGVAMRAVVDNADLVSLHGARPELLAAISWGVGAGLAALAAILVEPRIGGFDYYQMTLIVITAYAAAMVGRLKSLPLTFAGAMLLGLAGSYVQGYGPSDGVWSGLQPTVPVLFLFLVLLFLPQAQLRVGQIKGIKAVPVPRLSGSVTGAVAAVGAVIVLSRLLSNANVYNLGLALYFGLLMVSLLLLTGYGGFVSLAQFSFAAIGALAVSHFGGSLLSYLGAALAAGAVGALIALPLLRLRGLYLALGTLAFADLMDKLVFQASFAFGYGGQRQVDRLHIPGLDLSSDRSFVVAMAVILMLVAVGLLALRRGTFGRLLIAMRDSPAACGTLGLNLTRRRVLVFSMSAAIAGLAGALYGGLQTQVGPAQFDLLQYSLPLLLTVAVVGVTSMSGAVAGGVILMLLLQRPELKEVSGIIIGVGAILLGRNPNGLASYAFLAGRWVRRVVTRKGPDARPQASAPAPEFVDERDLEVSLSGTS